MQSKKLPAIMFYPSDWHNDLKVQSLTLYERAIWFELLLIMHVSEKRGRLILSGAPMEETWLAKKVGVKPETMTKVLHKFLLKGVAYKDEKGIIYNKRMVQDQRLREIRAESGSKGGNPNLVNQNSKERLNTKQTPLYSVSVSSSITISERVLEMAKKCHLNDEWLEQACTELKIPTHVIKSFCSQWIKDAQLKQKFDTYTNTQLTGFMIEDIIKEKPKLIPPPPKPKSRHDFWV